MKMADFIRRRSMVKKLPWEPVGMISMSGKLWLVTAIQQQPMHKHQLQAEYTLVITRPGMAGSFILSSYMWDEGECRDVECSREHLAETDHGTRRIAEYRDGEETIVVDAGRFSDKDFDQLVEAGR